MFNKTAEFYDKIYGFKDYKKETEALVNIIKNHVEIKNQSLLELACGTGIHSGYLSEYFAVEGLDISQEFVDIAGKRNPSSKFYQGDMINFKLVKKYDIITCLFSSIGYVKTLGNLEKTFENVSEHLKSGGLFVVEPWFTYETWTPGKVHAILIDEPQLKIARMNTSFRDGRLSYFDLHYLIGTPEGTEHFAERHELGLFEKEEMIAVFEKTGFEVVYYPEGITGRGLYVGKKN